MFEKIVVVALVVLARESIWLGVCCARVARPAAARPRTASGSGCCGGQQGIKPMHECGCGQKVLSPFFNPYN